MTSRESLLCELALEWAFGVPYPTIRDVALGTGAVDEVELQRLGHRLFADAARLLRGDIGAISLPGRLPAPGEH